MSEGHRGADQLATEVALIRRIARRAIDTIPALRQARLLSVDVQAEIGACHFKACPLRLEALLAADTLSFAAEIGGIRRHLDRSTGILTGGFLPRFHAGRPPLRQPSRDMTAAERKQRQRARERVAGHSQLATAALSQGV